MPLLEVRAIDKFFGGLHAVNQVSFSMERGLIKSVIGPNGAGKTTLFNLISGTIQPTSGCVSFQDKITTGLRPFEIAHLGMVRTFQNIKLCKNMTVLENVMLGRHTKSRAGFASCLFSLPWTWNEEKNIREEAMKSIELLGIADYANREVAHLPFGIQRSVEFARAMASQPVILLLDEPASGLNMRETHNLSSLIQNIRESGVTILLVEHDMGLVMDISDEIVVLNFGQKIAEGNPKEIQKNREVINIYLGDDDA